MKIQIIVSYVHKFAFECINLKTQCVPKIIWHVSMGYGGMNHVHSYLNKKNVNFKNGIDTI